MSAKGFLERKGLPLGETFDDCDLTWDSVIDFMNEYKATEVAAYRARLLEKVEFDLNGTKLNQENRNSDWSRGARAKLEWFRDLITKTE